MDVKFNLSNLNLLENNNNYFSILKACHTVIFVGHNDVIVIILQRHAIELNIRISACKSQTYNSHTNSYYRLIIHIQIIDRKCADAICLRGYDILRRARRLQVQCQGRLRSVTRSHLLPFNTRSQLMLRSKKNTKPTAVKFKKKDFFLTNDTKVANRD